MATEQPYRPQLDSTQAAALAREHWGIEGEITELGSYADRNFLITDARGIKRVFKVSALAHESREVVDMQTQALVHLSARPSSSRVPCPIASLTGETLVDAPDHAGEPCSLRVLSWIEGALWSDLEPTALAGDRGRALRLSLGRALAQLALDLTGFEHPGMERSFRWNLCEAEWIADDLDVIQAGPRRELIIDALAQFRARVAPRLPEFAPQLIHGDANDHNLVVGERELLGIFDFGDAVAAPAICDLAITIAYTGMTADPLAALAEVCAGYHQLRPLAANEVDLLFDLVRARLAVSVVCSAQAEAADPDNDHATASQAGAWTLLEALSALGRTRVNAGIAAACAQPAPQRVPPGPSAAALLARRRARLGPSLSLSYAKPLYLRRGEGAWLFDEHERAYLDCVNNVCHVGHCHPRVVAAASEQLARLNTNTRYLHEGILDYAERLCASLPEPLSVVFLVCSGSEANELALRIARAHTGGHDIAVVDAAYHGNTSTLIDISPYKFDGHGGEGCKPWVHVLDTPDPLRGRHGEDGPRYAARLAEFAETARTRGGKLAAFICESVLSCAGQIVPAPGFIAAAYEHARAAGAVCIADEVQVGFGRVGDAMWAFEAEGVVPDILTLGKPIGNGHPLAAVITTPALAASFATGMEYFNTFGGNPVSCAVGQAVLEVIETEGLMTNARETGAWLRTALASIEDLGIAQVRGRGLFLGVELVEGPDDLRPDAARAEAIVEHARERGVLLSTDGPAHNVIKIKPPLCFGPVEARILVATLTAAFAATA